MIAYLQDVVSFFVPGPRESDPFLSSTHVIFTFTPILWSFAFFLFFFLFHPEDGLCACAGTVQTWVSVGNLSLGLGGDELGDFANGNGLTL